MTARQMYNGELVKKWVYLVESDMPLTVTSGVGNTVIVTPTQGQALTVRDTPMAAYSGPQSIHQGYIKIELQERVT